MCDIKVCRICLRGDIKLYGFAEYNLMEYYEELHGQKMDDIGNLPCFFCYQCAALLHKFHKFKEKSNYSQITLETLLRNGLITSKAIEEVVSKNEYIYKIGILEILTTNSRIKTFSEEHFIFQSNQIDEKSCIEEESFSCYDNFYSDDDNSYKDPTFDPVAEELEMKEDIPIKREITEAFELCVDEENAFESTEVELKTEKTSPRKLRQKKVKASAQQEYDNHDIDDDDDIDEEKVKVKRKRKTKGLTTQPKKYKLKSQNKELKSLSFLNSEFKASIQHDYDNDIDVDNDIDEEKVKVKRKRKTKVLTTEPKKYKFQSQNKELKSLSFLKSGFWKKSTLSEEEALKEFEARAQDQKYLSASFKCTDCYRGFSKKNMLDRHIPLRHGEAIGPEICRFCKMRFKSPHFLNKHMHQHFTKYECLRCNLVCNLANSALFHEEYHNGVIRKCKHCDKEFRHLSTFYTHLRTHRSKHMCPLCGESFVSQLGLRLHTKLKHVATDSMKEVTNEHETNQKQSEPVERAKHNTYCEICKIKFENMQAFNKHLVHSALHIDDYKIIGDELAEYSDNEKEQYGLKIKPLVRRKTRVEKTLSAVRKYTTKKETAKKPTTCRQCGKHFNTQTACMKHHVAEHPGTSFFGPNERIICEICGASLAPGSVQAHWNQHTRSKMYTCDTCGRSFTTNTMLRNHMATHTGEKKYACSLCEKRFTQNGSLSLHFRTFHLKQPYPKRNRRKKIDKIDTGVFDAKEEFVKISVGSNYV